MQPCPTSLHRSTILNRETSGIQENIVFALATPPGEVLVLIATVSHSCLAFFILFYSLQVVISWFFPHPAYQIRHLRVTGNDDKRKKKKRFIEKAGGIFNGVNVNAYYR